MVAAIERLDATSDSDLEEVYQLYQKSYGFEADQIGARLFPPMMREVADLRFQASQFYGLREQGKLIGVAEVNDHLERQCDIYALVVDPGHFRRGHGSRLLSHVVQRYYLKPLFARSIYKNPRSTPLYGNFGFYDNGREFYNNGMQIVVWRLDPRN